MKTLLALSLLIPSLSWGLDKDENKINPKDLDLTLHKITSMPDKECKEVKADNLNVEFEKVTLSKNQPHIDAISWRYDNIGKVSK